MQTRIGFNGGEMSPEMACRVDMEGYMRGCSVLENWELSQMGGIKRRRGMRYVSSALSAKSVLMPYIYTYEDAEGGVWCVELDELALRVLSPDGAEAARFDVSARGFEPSQVRYKQINNLLLLTYAESEPAVLKRDEAGAWVLESWTYKEMPWRYNELREELLSITRTDSSGSTSYAVDFGGAGDTESLIEGRDHLRASYWMEAQEVESFASSVLEGVQSVTPPLSAVSKGARLVVPEFGAYAHYVCVQEWSKTDNYTQGMEDPSNYPDNFSLTEDQPTGEAILYLRSMSEAPNIEKGVRIALMVEYWDAFTCIKDFTAQDAVVGATHPRDYPSFFLKGIAIGEAVACRSAWSFVCSGVWYGDYEVRRSYESASLEAEWEHRGTSTSIVGAATNEGLSGDESEEECWMRLFITRWRRRSSTDLSKGYPADSCSNRLVVDGYKKHLAFAVSVVEDEAGDVVATHWVQEGKFPLYWQGKRVFEDWSWAAFSARYGYPQLCEVYNQRLVFASTRAQPQTIWMSRVDDLNNFMLGDTDDSALELTMSTQSQNAIAWMMAQNHRLLLGTAEAEWVISAGQSQAAISPMNAQLEDHGHIGSERLVLAAVDRVLYLERGAGRVYEYGYSIEADGYRSKDLTVFAPHVLTDHGGAVSSTLLRKPDTVAIFALADGQLALMTYNSFHNVHAWHRWTTEGKILSVCALPNGRAADRLYLIVQREGEISLELVDEYSGYSDGMHDYTSTLVTNALSNPMEQPVGRAPQQGTAFCFGAGWDADGVQITRDGADWMQVSRSGDQVAGWHELIAPAKWQYDNTVGLRVSGERGMHILALQG